MASVCLKTRANDVQQTEQNKVTQGEWTKLFPPKVHTEQQSLMYVKKFVTVAVSTLTFLRSMIDDEAFADKSLGKVKVKIINGDSGNQQAKLLNKWLCGAFDAIEKKYLKEMSLCVHEDPEAPEDVLEKYTFTFNYINGISSFNMEKNGAAGSNYMGSLMGTTRTILRDVATITEGLDKLPNKASLTMLLAYYDHTPDEYEPEGFTPSDIVEKPLPHWTFKRSFGKVDTKHHSLSLRVDTRQVPVKESHPVTNNFVQSQSEAGTQSQTFVDCVCRSSSLDEIMLTCAICSHQQHGACYRILSRDQEPSQHFCVNCCNDDDQPCTDRKLAKNKDDSRAVITCLLRRIMSRVCSRFDVDLNQVQNEMNLEDDLFQALLKLLKKHELINEDMSINQGNMEYGMKIIFGIKERPKDELHLLQKTGSMNLNENRVVKRKNPVDNFDRTGAGDNGKENRIHKRHKKSRSEETNNIDV